MTTQRVTVRIADLLQRVRRARTAAVTEHEKAVAAYPDAVKKWQAQAKSKLTKALKAVEQGNPPAGRYGVEVGSKPSKPDRPNTSRFDKDIALLEMASGETLSISTESNWGRYLA